MSEIELSLEVVFPFHFAFVKAEKLHDIASHFGSLMAALKASKSDWDQSNLLSPKQKERFFAPELPGLVKTAEDWALEPHQSIISLYDSAYPSLLKEISDPPILLYVRGDISLLSDPQLGIVGSRNSTRLGVETAKDFAQYLSSVGVTITSGLAAGIDAAAHQGGLSGQGKTVSVVGTGLDRVYPASNRALARQIAEEGVMVSEYPLGTKPMPHHFPQRNRIISGLSMGILVVEAALKSGSLITAKMAMEQGREVFAVPGAINNPHARGCHQLIRSGAKLVESGQDVLEELSPLLNFALDNVSSSEADQAHLFDGSLGLNDAQTSKERPRKDRQKGIMAFIEYEPISLDELSVLSKLPVSEIQSQLIMLVLSGELEAMSAGRWRRLK